MNENKTKITSIVRIALSLVAMIIIILSWLEVVPSNIALAGAIVCVGVVTVWNGIDAAREKRIKSAVLNFAMIGILLVLALASIIL